MIDLRIYTDGSVSSNNIGGLGYRILYNNDEGNEEIYDGYAAGFRNANNGQMEIIACSVALEEAIQLFQFAQGQRVVLYTDSKYVADNYKNAMFVWPKNKWCRPSGRPAQDGHLWKKLISIIKKYNKRGLYIDIQWVKGHGKDKHNIAVDQMAKQAANLPVEQLPKSGPITISQPRKIVKSRKLEIGCVNIAGQRFSIKILSSKLLKPQNIWCYQYEVVSKSNNFYGLVDQIFSEFFLEIGKAYYIKVNSENKNPRIIKVYWELKNQNC